MASSVQKPLPAIPPVPGSSPHAVLTDESKAHLSKFIQHVLDQEEDRVGSQSWRDTWTRVIESVLDALGQSIRDEDWLAGLKLRRQWVRSREEKAAKHQDVATNHKALVPSIRDGKRTNNADDKPSDPVPPGDPASSVHDTARLAPRPDSTNRSAPLDQLRLCLSGKRPSADQQANPVNHLLLCVASFENQSISTKESGEPNQISGCTFNTKEFLLPHIAPDEKDGGIVLFGLEEWDGQ